MTAKTISGNSTDQLSAALDEYMNDGFRPTLALVFISVKQDREAVSALFRRAGIDMIGATSAGEFIEDHESGGGIVAMLLDLDDPLRVIGILDEKVAEPVESKQLAEGGKLPPPLIIRSIAATRLGPS